MLFLFLLFFCQEEGKRFCFKGTWWNFCWTRIRVYLHIPIYLIIHTHTHTFSLFCFFVYFQHMRCAADSVSFSHNLRFTLFLPIVFSSSWFSFSLRFSLIVHPIAHLLTNDYYNWLISTEAEVHTYEIVERIRARDTR